MDRGAMPVLKGECCMCACTSHLLPLPASHNEGDSSLCVYILGESCVKVLLKAALVWPVMSLSCLPLCVSVSLGYVLSFATTWTCKVASTFPSLDPVSSGTRLGPSGYARAVQGWNSWRRQLCSLHHLTVASNGWDYLLKSSASGQGTEKEKTNSEILCSMVEHSRQQISLASLFEALSKNVSCCCLQMF